MLLGLVLPGLVRSSLAELEGAQVSSSTSLDARAAFFAARAGFATGLLGAVGLLAGFKVGFSSTCQSSSSQPSSPSSHSLHSSTGDIPLLLSASATASSSSCCCSLPTQASAQASSSHSSLSPAGATPGCCSFTNSSRSSSTCSSCPAFAAGRCSAATAASCTSSAGRVCLQATSSTSSSCSSLADPGTKRCRSSSPHCQSKGMWLSCCCWSPASSGFGEAGSLPKVKRCVPLSHCKANGSASWCCAATSARALGASETLTNRSFSANCAACLGCAPMLAFVAPGGSTTLTTADAFTGFSASATFPKRSRLAAPSSLR
mmetsp:Transcript_37938/g.120567  ORF Transcript_37938/g.120567 Transcript_37938/m.120567 type:complete len:318 (-) Transcript_37938:641-1594(-)